MIIVSSIKELRASVASARAAGKRIGFVPTMGALHRGHISLVERSRSACDVTVMSIFVNPLQFAPNEDLSRYPRPVESDNRMAKDAAVDILFRPEVRDMYPGGRSTTVAAGELGSIWEGQSRPGHFDGVLTVVAKLFNIVQADIAVFGRKDLQQAALVSAMIRDLDFPMSIVLGPIVREDDGLALSSRNRYLIPEERRQAVVLSKALSQVRQAFETGERDTLALETAGRQILAAESGVTEDYLAVVDPVTFKRSPRAEPDFAAIVAARIGKTRLIDNITIGNHDQD